MALPMWVPHESLMGFPYRTHINTHLGPMLVLYFLLAGMDQKTEIRSYIKCRIRLNIDWFKHILFPKYDDHTYINDIYTNYRIRTEA